MDDKKGYSFHDIVFKKEWSYTIGAILLATLAIALVIVTGGSWGVTGPLTQWGGWILSQFGVDVARYPIWSGVPNFNFWTNQPSMTNLGIVVGALVAVLLAGQFRIKKIKSSKNIAAAICGGLLMGIGARLAFGCNIGALFSALPAFSLHGWAFFASMFLAGVWGSRLLKSYFM